MRSHIHSKLRVLKKKYNNLFSQWLFGKQMKDQSAHCINLLYILMTSIISSVGLRWNIARSWLAGDFASCQRRTCILRVLLLAPLILRFLLIFKSLRKNSLRLPPERTPSAAWIWDGPHSHWHLQLHYPEKDDCALMTSLSPTLPSAARKTQNSMSFAASRHHQ